MDPAQSLLASCDKKLMAWIREFGATPSSRVGTQVAEFVERDGPKFLSKLRPA